MVKGKKGGRGRLTEVAAKQKVKGLIYSIIPTKLSVL